MRRLLLTCSSFGLLFSSYVQADAPNVVTTVKPLSMIVQALTKDVTTSDTLLPAGTSPHDYALRPSDARKLHDADLVIWVGPELERFLTKILDGHSNAFALTAQPGIDFRHYGESEQGDSHATASHNGHDHHDEDAHAAHEHSDEAHGHDHEGIDPHVWLGPETALQAANVITQKLIALDPSHKTQYQANLKAFNGEVTSAVTEIEQSLKPLKDKGYFVFHDGYGYFEDQFQLNNLGHFTVEPDRRPGAKTLINIRASLKGAQAQCVFSEPQFTPAVVNSVVRGTDVKVGVLDPMATDIQEGADGYPQFLRQLGQRFVSCLQ
ncbi:zinc ABC transporter substrate-binding protein ZnuA [Photobacterium japonica]|uniref:zinc ABC transporter substrate-binding protein ZnuA n=1 Tax=Photobacterium japonica TaxID=2910235 RepID=UPI003D1431E3